MVFKIIIIIIEMDSVLMGLEVATALFCSIFGTVQAYKVYKNVKDT